MIGQTDRQLVSSRLAFYARHLCEDVLPWWLENALDDEFGGVFTYWEGAGTGLRLRSLDKYVWSQGRWGWVTAMLARLADRRPDLKLDGESLRRRSLQTARLLRKGALLPDGTCASVVSREGQPREQVPGNGLHDSVYSDLFVALAFAAADGFEPEAAWGRSALDLLTSAAVRINTGTARTEPYAVPSGYQSFALQMILLNAGAEVFLATKADAAAKIALEAALSIRRDFALDADICELRPLRPDLGDTLDARHRNPGHAIEALWMYQQAADCVPAVAAVDPDYRSWLVAALDHMCGLGWDGDDGGLFRFVDCAGGAPKGKLGGTVYEHLVRTSWDWKLWWPHNEALYAALLLWLRTGDPRAGAWFRRIDDYAFSRFPAGPGQEWKQILDRRGNPMPADPRAALPVKDPYHLLRCLFLLLELAPELGASPRKDLL